MKNIKLSYQTKCPILACGADLKGSFALAKGSSAFLVDGFGDLGDLDNLTNYEKSIKRHEKRLGIKPNIIACDLHPGYNSTHFAESSQLTAQSPKLFKVQHHESHIASAIIDGAIKGDVIGIAFDGTGFGSDGNMWGGEFFTGSAKAFKRVAHMEYIPMPGGEAAICEPWRMGVSYLYRAFGDKFIDLKIDYVKRLDKVKCGILKKMMDKDINSPLTSSIGRLFDAVASIVLAKKKASFEAELPIELEKIAITHCEDSYDFDIRSNGGVLIVNPSKIIKRVVKDLSDGVDKGIISSKFHNTVARIIVKICSRLKLKKVVLSGGVFQNRYLSRKAVKMLENGGFSVFTHSRIPANDSGVALGQIAIASARTRCA